MLTATFDTNIAADRNLVALAKRAGYSVATSSVTHREMEATCRDIEPDETVLEDLVLDESPFGSSLGSETSVNGLERVLRIISNGSFPPRRDGRTPVRMRVSCSLSNFDSRLRKCPPNGAPWKSWRMPAR